MTRPGWSTGLLNTHHSNYEVQITLRVPPLNPPPPPPRFKSVSQGTSPKKSNALPLVRVTRSECPPRVKRGNPLESIDWKCPIQPPVQDGKKKASLRHQKHSGKVRSLSIFKLGERASDPSPIVSRPTGWNSAMAGPMYEYYRHIYYCK